jgi:hypothetical protein
MKRAIVFVLLASLAATQSLAEAWKQESRGKARGRAKQEEKSRGPGFSSEQKREAAAYFVETHGRGVCPPGLAKKNNGCLPPGQAKKRYEIGVRLSASIELGPIPVELSVRIGQPPEGYAYAIVDGDLIQLVVGTLLVVDAIEGLID